ncbi:hypothetical protein Tco_0743422 [Tanacetum coccineum]
MDYLCTTKAELGINIITTKVNMILFDRRDKLNDLTNKKRKHADDIHDYFKANKRLKSSVQYGDHLAGTMLNKHVLGMIMFNSYHRQNFITIEDLKDFLNTMLYTVQEIFFKRHQGPRLDDHAKTVLTRLGSIFTSVYAAVQKLKKAFAKSFSSAWLTIPSWTMSISLTEVEMKCFTSRMKPEGQWTGDERKAANLDQRLKSLIMSVLPDDQMNSVINCLTAKSTWDDLILYHDVPYDVKESRIIDLKLCYNTFKFKEGETLTQTLTKYKALMNEFVNVIKLSKLEINTGFINRLLKKWLSFCQSLRNINHVKDSELASLFGKLKYEENLIDSIYETEKNKSLVSATPLSTAFFSTVQNFQDSPDDEEDTRSSQEYLNDLEEKYQARALLAKSKRFFKKGTQRFSSAKETDQTECHKYGKKELRPTKDFKSKYNKVKAKLALLSSSATASKAATVKNKGLIIEAYGWDEEEVSSDESEMVEVKVLMALAKVMVDYQKEMCQKSDIEQIPSQKKRILGVYQLTEDPSCSEQKDLVFVKSSADDTKVSIPGVERPWLSKDKGFILPNHDTGRILPVESQRNTIDPPVVVTNSSATDYDSADESSICSTPLPPLKKLDGDLALVGKLKSVKIKDDPPLAIVMKN